MPIRPKQHLHQTNCPDSATLIYDSCDDSSYEACEKLVLADELRVISDRSSMNSDLSTSSVPDKTSNSNNKKPYYIYNNH